MATSEAVKNLVAKTTPTTDLRSLIEKSARELGRALPPHMRPERLVRIALTCLRTNPELSKCTPESFLGSLFVSAQLGIEPVGGQAYLLPFNNNRQIAGDWKTVKECQFVLGYKGLASLFYRHEKAISLSWGVVHQKDDFSYQYGTEAFLKHKPVDGERGPVKGFWVCAKLANGGNGFMYMSHADCVAHGQKHSKTFDKKTGEFYKSSPWRTSEESMCLKSVLIQLGKLLPLSVEVQRAIQADETSRDYRTGIEDALDIPTTTDWAEGEGTDDNPQVIPPKKPEAKAAEKDTDPDWQLFRCASTAKTEIAGVKSFVHKSDEGNKVYVEGEDLANFIKGSIDGVEIRTEKRNDLTWAIEARSIKTA